MSFTPCTFFESVLCVIFKIPLPKIFQTPFMGFVLNGHIFCPQKKFVQNLYGASKPSDKQEQRKWK